MSDPILIIGGTGVISTSIVRLARDEGREVIVLNRGRTTPSGPDLDVETLHADVRDVDAVRAVLGDRSFASVVEFVAFTPEHVQRDIEVFRGRTDQYIFISSASAYQTPPATLPVTEDTPLDNPIWEYSQLKAASEAVLVSAHADTGFPATIVRPSHTYDATTPPFDGGWTVVDRIRRGAPVVVPGDGTSLWTLTHTRDFARAFLALVGNRNAIGEAYHITSDVGLPWNDIYMTLAAAAGCEPDLVHVTSDAVASVDADLGAAWLGDKSQSMLFDNTKIRSLAPNWRAEISLEEAAKEIVDWHDADPTRRTVDPVIDGLFDRLVRLFDPRRIVGGQDTPIRQAQ